MPDRPSDKTSAIAPRPPAKGEAARASERRAKALRDNLLKRKSQARARGEPDSAKANDSEE
jgi:hypothetical protein